MRLLFFSFANYISLSQKRIASDVAEVLAKPHWESVGSVSCISGVLALVELLKCEVEVR